MTSLPPPPEDECDCGDDFSIPGGDFFQCDNCCGGDDGDDGDSDEAGSEHLQRKTSLEGIPAPRLHPPPPGVHHQLIKVFTF